MNSEKPFRRENGGLSYAKNDINGAVSVNGKVQSEFDCYSPGCNAYTASVDDVLCRSQRQWEQQQLAAAGNDLELVSNCFQMSSSGSRTSHLPKSGNGNISLEDVDVIDLDGLNFDEEDGWLLKLKEPSIGSPSPYAWVREDFERKDLGTPSASLLHTLEQTSRKKAPRFHVPPFATFSLSPSESSEVLCDGNQNQRTTEVPHQTPMPDNDYVQKSDKPIKMVNSTPALSSASDADFNQVTPKTKGRYEIDTRTFTRPKKGKKLNNILNPVEIDAEICDPVLKEECGTTVGQLSPELSDELPVLDELHVEDRFLKLEDVTDVQVLARMQEESLRQSYSNIPLGLTPRSQRRGIAVLASRDDGRRSQLSSSDLSSLSNNSSLAMKSTHSLSSSGSESSASRSESLTNVNMSQEEDGSHRTGLRKAHPRSLPNILKATKYSVPRSIPSDSKLDQSSGRRSLPASATKCRVSAEGISPVKKMSGHDLGASDCGKAIVPPQPTSVNLRGSATVTKIASSIPRPSSGSKLRQPTHWKKGLTTPAKNDGVWREGCF